MQSYFNYARILTLKDNKLDPGLYASKNKQKKKTIGKRKSGYGHSSSGTVYVSVLLSVVWISGSAVGTVVCSRVLNSGCGVCSGVVTAAPLV